MSIVLTVVVAWIGLTIVALVVMSLLGRAGRAADDASADDVARVRAWQESATLGVVAPHPLHEGEAAVCAPCATKVPGLAPGEPCPTCGTPVLESPRVIAPRRQASTPHGVRRAV